MKVIIFTLIIIVIIALLKNKDLLMEKFGSYMWSRPNKCFDCEKQITSMQDAHLAFPTKCFDCEKNSSIPYLEGPTKCYDCEHRHRNECMIVDKDEGKFDTYMRNRFVNRMR
jgi:hypothetical protein